MPEKFDLTYVGTDGRPHRPVMIHRAILGTLERFIGVLIEHYAGAFPTWLAPVQVQILPVADRHDEYAASVAGRLEAAGIRVELTDATHDTLGARVRKGKLDKIPYVLVVGDADVEGDTVGVNARGTERPERDVSVDEFIERIHREVTARS